jgi:hypothetical protein
MPIWGYASSKNADLHRLNPNIIWLQRAWSAAGNRKPIQPIPQITGQNMRISAGGLDVRVPQQLRHQADVLRLAQHPGGKGVAQIVEPKVTLPMYFTV